MKLRLFTCFLLLTSLLVEVDGNTCGTDPYPWRPQGPGEYRDDLVCDNSCNTANDVLYCCTCNNCAVWEGNEVQLFVEYVTVLGKGLVLSEATYNDSLVYGIEHTDAELTEIPSNVCNWDTDMSTYEHIFEDMQPFWDRIVKIDLRRNKIRRLGDINCMERLDYVNLQGNKLTHISNQSFAKLNNLRSINFANNLIQTIDPSTVRGAKLNLFRVDFTWNVMTNIDVTNMLSLYPYCRIEFSHNNISTISNVRNFTLDLSETYGPGSTSVSNNEIQQFPNFRRLLGLDGWNQIGKLLDISVDFTNNPTKCDCTYEPIMSLAEEIIVAIMANNMKLICQTPSDLQGLQIKDVPLNRLVCPVPAQSGCQKPECLCIDEPNENRIYIDCSDSGLDELPSIPESEYSNEIYLNVSGNNIKEIRDVPYLARMSVFDISRNDISYITPIIARQMENTSFLDISNNPRLKTLPQEFQLRDVCSTYMKKLQIDCNCENRWIQTWLQSTTCKTTENLFTCDVPNHGQIHALSFHEDQLDCFPMTNLILLGALIAGGLLALLILNVTAYYFRYEILILCVRLMKLKSNKVVPQYKYDVYISYNDKDDDAPQWVGEVLLHNLLEAGYKVFLPNRDLIYGQERNEQVVLAIQNARNVLIVLSNSYMEERDDGMRPWTENEWKYGWNNFKTAKCKNIVLVNFDHVSVFNFPHPQIRAFLRVGCTVDFGNYNRCIMEDIYTKLGRPFRGPELEEKNFNNKNRKFAAHDLFAVKPIYQCGILDPENEFEMEPVNNQHILTKIDRTVRADKQEVKHNHGGTMRKCQHRKCYACQYKENLHHS